MAIYNNDRPSIPAALRREIEIEAGHECSITTCREHTYLEIHHINDNREDNRKENLILLCDKHHKMAHSGVIDRQSLYGYKRILQSNLLSENFDRAREANRIKDYIDEITKVLSYFDFGTGEYALIDFEAGYWFPEMVFQNLLFFSNNWVEYERNMRSYDANIRETQDQIFSLLVKLKDLRLEGDYRPLGNGEQYYKFSPSVGTGTREYDVQINEQRDIVANVLKKIQQLMHELYFYLEVR